jgi:hypothetical protein
VEGEDGVLGDVFADVFCAAWIRRSMMRCAISVAFHSSKYQCATSNTKGRSADLANLLPPPYVFVPRQLSPLED